MRVSHAIFNAKKKQLDMLTCQTASFCIVMLLRSIIFLYQLSFFRRELLEAARDLKIEPALDIPQLDNGKRKLPMPRLLSDNFHGSLDACPEMTKMFRALSKKVPAFPACASACGAYGTRFPVRWRLPLSE